MKLKRTGATAVAITLLAGSGVSGVTNVNYVMESQEQTLGNTDYKVIAPMWDNISSISPYISVEGTTLYPEVYIKAKSPSGSISGAMYLEKYVSGRWTSETSWSFKGTGNVFLSKSYRGTAGAKYRIRVVVTVDGETAVAISGICKV